MASGQKKRGTTVMNNAAHNAEAPIRLGITGTDTEIGKTVVTCALAARARACGLSIAVMKPIETGVFARTRFEGPSMRSDAERLKAAAASSDPIELIRPIAMLEPTAPMVAAQRAGVALDLTRLDAAREQLERGRDVLLVEGAGGLLVPITRTFDFSHLFAQWRCDLVIVAGNRLGVLNHALLTVRAAEAAGLHVRAVVLTSMGLRDASVAEATNFDALTLLLPHIRVIRFPWVDKWEDPDALCAAAEGTGLDLLLEHSTPSPFTPLA